MWTSGVRVLFFMLDMCLYSSFTFCCFLDECYHSFHCLLTCVFLLSEPVTYNTCFLPFPDVKVFSLLQYVSLSLPQIITTFYITPCHLHDMAPYIVFLWSLML